MSLHLGTRAVIFLTDPQDIEIILNSPEHIDKPVEYSFFKPWLGDSMLFNNSAKWLQHRKTILATVHIQILKTYVSLFYENSLDLVKRLGDKISQQFNCHNYLSVVTINMLIETAMGVKREKVQNIGFDYAMAVMKLSEIVHKRQFDASLRFDQLFRFSKLAKLQQELLNTVQSATKIVIQEKLKDIEEKQIKNTHKIEAENSMEKTENGMNTTNYKMHYARDDIDDMDENDVREKKRLSFLEMLIDMKKNGQMIDKEISDNVNAALFVGHGTIATTSSFVLCVLGYLSEIQARVHEELDSIFHDSDRQCTFQDTIEMKYLERVILETLRLFPTVPLFARKLNKDIRIVTGNYVLPKDATIVIFPFVLHRTEKYYPNPLVFNPDNFLPDNMRQRNNYAYIPFSAGPRSCLGRKYAMLKLKVLLSTILRNYRITSDVSYQDFLLLAEIVLKRADGFHIKIEQRKKKSRI
ncbi:PREDICTED: cytochrome P450 4g15-like isoform X2 [Dinoponera quadriceps]|nr:PREDICTED: cytochrome P450 4g15-like isoform X2 [Dinoponera quadriceps]